MSTWTGVLVETGGREDFWDVVGRHGIEPLASAVPPWALLPCERAAALELAEALSREFAAGSLAFIVQTAADVHELHAFDRGRRVRCLQYGRDGGGWLCVEGMPQAWERAYFFDELDDPDDPVRWPDMLDDEISDEDLACYRAARRSGDAAPVLRLLHPSSTRPMARVCAYLGVEPQQPAGRWAPPSLWSRLLGRRRR